MVEIMGEIVFVGLGLYDDYGISLKGMEEVKSADSVFLEHYTSFLPGFSLERFEKLSGKKVYVVYRRQLEDEDGKVITEAAERGKAVLLVPGDPLVATTHVALRIAAERQGIKTRIVHGASIISAVMGLSGLQSYKFGKTVTIPFPENFSETPYNVIFQNKKLGLHTLCLLDVNVEEERYLSINEALKMLLNIEKERKKHVAEEENLAIGIARAGSRNPIVKAGQVKKLLKYDFKGPPQSLIFPGKLHFMEAEALITLAKAPSTVRKMVE